MAILWFKPEKPKDKIFGKLKMTITHPYDIEYKKGTLFSSILKIGENTVSFFG